MPCGMPLIPAISPEKRRLFVKSLPITQSSEFDCGPTTLMNALRFLYPREILPPGLLRGIWTMGNDTFNESGEPGKHGTSAAAIRYLSDWLNRYGIAFHFPIHTLFLSGRQARIEAGGPVLSCLEKGGCALIRCWAGGYGHYVLLTGRLDTDEIAFWDPYEESPDFSREPGRRVLSLPWANRAASLAILNGQGNSDYEMGRFSKREILCFDPPDLSSK